MVDWLARASSSQFVEKILFQKVVPVNNQIHANKRVKEISSFAFAARTHIAYLTLPEFTRAAPIFPVVFLEDKAKDEFRPVALLGLSPEKNLFVDAAGKWLASYVPAIIRRYPFALTPSDQDGQFVVCIDEASDLVSDADGSALFDITGAPTQIIDNVKRYLAELQQMEIATSQFCRFLKEHNMFTPLNLRLQDGADTKDISGCYVINEERLNNLSDELFLSIKAKAYLPAIYAHLLSLAQTERLMKMQQAAAAA